MNLVTYSPALLLVYVWILLWITMDLRFEDLTPTQKWLVPLLVATVAAINQIIYVAAGYEQSGKLIPLTMHLPYFLLFLHLTKYGVIKTAFMILTGLVFSSPIVLVTTCCRLVIPLDSPLMLLSNLAAYAIMLLVVYLFFRRGFHDLLNYGGNKLFLLLCLVPLLYYIHVFTVANVDFDKLAPAYWIILRILPFLNVSLFYFLLLFNYWDLNRRQELETAQVLLSQELDAAAEQLALLNEAQAQSAIYRHDIRHHLMAIKGFLGEGDLHQAEDYIQKVCGDIDAISPERFCENRLVNLLCASFTNQAKRRGVRLTVEAGLPETVALSDTELCSMISNGLENAINAAAGLEQPQRWVTFLCHIQLDKLLIEIRNPYRGEITLRDGLPLTGQEEHGYGCRSIRAIVKRNRGLFLFQPDNGVFTLRIALPL